jgi:hypothetical protein
VLPAETAAKYVREIIKAGDCKGHVGGMSMAMGVGRSKLSADERLNGSLLLQRCAMAEKAWKSVLQASFYLVDNAPDKAHPEDIISAYLGLGDEPHALAALKVLDKKYPSQRAHLTVAVTLIACHRNDFKACHTATTKMLGVLKGMKDPPHSAMFENAMFHTFSAAALGMYGEYDADRKELDKLAAAAHVDPAKLTPFDNKVAQARANKLFIDFDAAKELPLGTYHYMTGNKPDAGSLLALRLVNQDKQLHEVKVAVEVVGLTETMTQTLSLPPGEEVQHSFTPPLKIDFDVAKLRAPRDSQLALHVTDAKSGKSVLDQTIPISVLPRDYLPLRHRFGSDESRPTFVNAAAWITPNVKEVEALLAKAKERIDDGSGQKAFTGEQRTTLPQVKALFEELRARGMTYVMDPDVFDPHGQVQRTRLPAEVLRTTNAQCLEGTLLYATLMEAIGLRPTLVFVPGHAFIAWHPSAKDGMKAPLVFLETTLTGSTATFDQAMTSATNHFLEAYKEKDFDLGTAALVDINELRSKGYTAQPF